MDTKEQTLTRFLRDPNSVTAQLDTADVVLTRRDGDALFLQPAQRAQETHSAVMLVVRLIRDVTDDRLGAELVTKAILRQAPWVVWLTKTDQDAMITELTAVLQAAADLDRLDLFTHELDAWRMTAEVHADPELAARLAESIDELVDAPVARPA